MPDGKNLAADSTSAASLKNGDASGTATGSAGASTTPASPAPQVSDEQLQKIISGAVSQTVERLGEANRPQPQAEATIEEPDEEDILEAIEAGDRKKAAALQRRKTAALEQRIRRNSVDPLAVQGGEAIRQLARQTVSSLPYADEYGTEIDALLRTVPAGQVVTPQVVQWAYRQVIGAHTVEIAKREREAAIRETRNSMPASTPSSAGGDDEGEHDFAEIAGPETMSAIKEKGKSRRHHGLTPAREAQKMGFADERDWAKQTKEMREFVEEHPTLGLDEDGPTFARKTSRSAA